MKQKWMLGIVAVVCGVTLQAGEKAKDADLKKVLDEQAVYLETSQPGIKLSGYVDAGYTYNFTGNRTIQATRGNNDGNAARDSKGDFNLHNVKLVLEKSLSEKKDEWSSGFRVDMNYGEDAHMVTGSTATDGASALWLQ